MTKRSVGLVIIAVAVSAGLTLFAVPSPSASAKTTAIPLCSASHLSTKGTIKTRAGGTTVRLALTSHYFPTCSWSYGTKFQFLSAGGAPVGAPHSLPAPASAAPALVRDTFQVVESLSTMEGVRCTSHLASALAVTTPNGARLVVHFPKTVGVCVNGTTAWTTLAGPTFPRPARCQPSALRVSIGRSAGATGTVYYPIIFTNVGAAACVVSGVPAVQPTTGALAGVAHIFVGPRAGAAAVASRGHGDPVRLDHAKSATATFGVSETGNYTPSTCAAKSAQSLSVGLAKTGNWWVKLPISVCSKLTSTTIWGVVPAGSGAVP